MQPDDRSGCQADHAIAISDTDSAELTDRFASMPPHQRHKPAPEAYHSVASELDVNPGDICLVACHVWDTLGALGAGWQAGLILREGNAQLDLGPQPNYIGADLNAIADQLIARDQDDNAAGL
jgi:2-haloacid dehalogenase